MLYITKEYEYFCSVLTGFLRYSPQTGITDWSVSSFVMFFRKLHNDFHNNWDNLHSGQQCVNVPFLSHPHQHSFSYVYFSWGLEMRCNLNVVLICIFDSWLKMLYFYILVAFVICNMKICIHFQCQFMYQIVNCFFPLFL